MHGEIMHFLRECKDAIGSDVLSVVEVGSMEMHGTPRDVFESQSEHYIGVDWRPGPGVDMVALAHNAMPLIREKAKSLEHPAVNLVICCQMLEHDPYWRRTLAESAATVKHGGWMILTWAGPDYKPHELETAPVPNYYENRTIAEVIGAVAEDSGRAVTVHRAEYRRGKRDALVLLEIGGPTRKGR